MEYLEHIMKYNELIQKAEEFSDLLSLTMDVKVPRMESCSNNAIIVLGFSGNGKTTVIKDFVRLHPEYVVISIDQIFRNFVNKFKNTPSLTALHSEFGRVIHENLGKPLIFDGNFLNLFNRSALCDYLHENGYNINMIDMRSILEDTILNRVLNETDKAIKKNGIVYPSNDEYMFYFQEMSRKVNAFYLEERKSAFMDLQESYGTIHWGPDKVFDAKCDLDELALIGDTRK